MFSYIFLRISTCSSFQFFLPPSKPKKNNRQELGGEESRERQKYRTKLSFLLYFIKIDLKLSIVGNGVASSIKLSGLAKPRSKDLSKGTFYLCSPDVPFGGSSLTRDRAPEREKRIMKEREKEP